MKQCYNCYNKTTFTFSFVIDHWSAMHYGLDTKKTLK
jgi:hypothetical protein